ncbi:MAG: alpha/beta hydrolase [Leptolyngbya sp. RL_3_1]|nr:alpha/beta hydrolase [Leptolyngbya sp. RL_3_1]
MKLEALWLSVSPNLARFDQRLLQHLAKGYRVGFWEYTQPLDAPCCLDPVVVLLHDFLKPREQPVHLVSHGISGIVAWAYACQHPERVRSLTLLSVGANPMVTWHAHYYALRRLLPCGRDLILAQMARLLFGVQPPSMTAALVERLKRDLDHGLTLHALPALVQGPCWSTAPVAAPLLVCNGANDVIADANDQAQWAQWLKRGDRRWVCPEGRHFFHYDYPKLVAEAIQDHWQNVASGCFTPHVRSAGRF